MTKEVKVTVYTPEDRYNSGFFLSLLTMARNIMASRELIFRLFLRDFFASYRKSFLGVAWVLLAPLMGIISWIFMNATGVLKPGNTDIPYPAYLLIGTSIWGLFMGFYQSSCGTLAAGQGFIFQVKYPHEALLMKQVLEHISNFLVGFIVNLLVLLAFHVVPSWKIIFLPIVVLPLFFMGAGIGLVISVVSVVAHEGKRLVDFALGLALYLTPIIYSSKTDNPILAFATRWNPLSYLIGGVRDLIFYGRIDHPEAFLAVSALSFLIFLLALRFFYVSEIRVIEKLL